MPTNCEMNKQSSTVDDNTQETVLTKQLKKTKMRPQAPIQATGWRQQLEET